MQNDLLTEGYHQGVVADVAEVGRVTTPYGVKAKVAVILESEEGPKAELWMTKTPQAHVPLQCLRAALQRRLLNERERCRLQTADLRQELAGRPVGFLVNHRQDKTGRVYANVLGVWPLLTQAAA